jgi:hypothetical protein
MGKIPDEVKFGHNAKGDVIDYGYVRAISDNTELIDLLRIRLQTFLINQVQPLQTSRSPFPLTVMTCVGIETLGEIFIPEDKDDTSFRFVEISKKLSQTFGRKLSKKYEKKLSEFWGNKDVKNIDCYGKVLYRFFRNTMIHGYQGKGVFLSYEDLNKIEVDEETSFIKLNPDWFWNSYKEAFNKLFIDAKTAQDANAMRKNCLKYINGYLLGI